MKPDPIQFRLLGRPLFALWSLRPRVALWVIRALAYAPHVPGILFHGSCFVIGCAAVAPFCVLWGLARFPLLCWRAYQKRLGLADLAKVIVDGAAAARPHLN